MAANAVLKKKLAVVHASVEPEKEWWEVKRAMTKADFMRELDEDAAAAAAAATATHASLPQAAPAQQAEKMVKGQSSDGSEEAVLVETPAQAAAGGGGGGGGKGKKKKGKK
jgi:hypothetical protein